MVSLNWWIRGMSAKSYIATEQGYCVLFWTNLRNSTLQNGSCMATYLLSHIPFEQDEQDLMDTTEKAETFSCGPLQMDTLVFADQQKLTLCGHWIPCRGPTKSISL